MKSEPTPRSLVKAQVIPTWQPAFLAELEQTGNLTASCRVAGVKLSTIASRRQTDPEFGERVLTLLRNRRLERDPNDMLVEVPGQSVDWVEPWAEDENYTNEQAFLMILGRTLNASEACRSIGIAYNAYKYRRTRDPEFDNLCRAAIQRACDEIEGALFSRALAESDAAAVAMLRAHRAEIYRTDNTKGDAEKSGPTLEEAMRRGFTQRQQGSLSP